MGFERCTDKVKLARDDIEGCFDFSTERKDETETLNPETGNLLK